MSSVALDRAEFVRPREPLRLIKTDIMTGQHEDGAPVFEWGSLRVLPDEDFDFLKPKKSNTVEKTTEPKKEDSHV